MSVTSRTDGDPVRVMLVEDHHLVRAAIATTLEQAGIEVVAQAATAEEALTLLTEARLAAEVPDVILIDIDLPGMNGIAFAREIAPRAPGMLIVMLSGSGDDEHLLASVRAGAAGYLTKDLSPEALARAVRGVVEGDLAMPRRMAARVVRELLESERRRRHPAGASGVVLSGREQQVLALVAGGLTDRAIAERLGISPRTVGHHLGSILAKLGVASRAAAVRAWRAGMGSENQAEPPAQESVELA
jgi:DNA-binding NarL/FixJ family response regulator